MVERRSPNQYKISLRQEFKLMSDIYDCLVSQKPKQDFLLQKTIRVYVIQVKIIEKMKMIITLKRCDPV